MSDVMKSDDDLGESAKKQTEGVPADYDSDAGDELPEPSDESE